MGLIESVLPKIIFLSLPHLSRYNDVVCLFVDFVANLVDIEPSSVVTLLLGLLFLLRYPLVNAFTAHACKKEERTAQVSQNRENYGRKLLKIFDNSTIIKPNIALSRK